MTELSAKEILKAAEQSGLVSASSLRDIGDDLTKLSGEQLVEHMVQRRVLTKFQADKLLRGDADFCRLGDRYLLCELLGSGGMGTVFLARDISCDKQVAIKILPPASVREADATARFQREALALAQLSHPNIIQAIESGDDGERHFLVMEYIAGKSLGQVLFEQGRLTPTTAAEYVFQAAQGLHHAHLKGLVHRDIKPSNLFLTHDGCVKLLDLGLARFLQDHIGDATLTLEGSGMGTPDYMSPEQFRNARHVDVRSDIYSLGCTLYHLIAGQVPFPGSSMSEKFKAHVERQPPALQSFCADVPAGLMLAVQHMMAKRPEDRFATAEQAGEALAPFVAGSSALLPAIQATACWTGSHLSISLSSMNIESSTQQPAWYRRRATWACLSAAALLLLLAWPASRWIWPTDTREPAAQGQGLAQSQGQDQPAAPGQPKQLVTVAATEGMTADCRTLRDGLAQVLPGGRIQVLDDAEYEESLVLNDPEKHQGITIEAPGGAVLVQTQLMPSGLSIQNVAGVTVRGLRFLDRDAPIGSSFVHIRGQTPGLVLEDLEFNSTKIVRGITIENEWDVVEGQPLIIRNCTFKVGYDAIAIGSPGNASFPAGNVLISGNEILRALRGIVTFGPVHHLHVVGNIVVNCEQTALQLSDPVHTRHNILFANNVVRNCFHGFRVWDDPPFETLPQGMAEVTNNVFLESLHGDVLYVLGGEESVKGDFDEFLQSISFHHNARDYRGDFSSNTAPKTETDLHASFAEFISIDPTLPEFMRLRDDSKLVSAGAGTTDSSLPAFVGPRPPSGTADWDWMTTWKARIEQETADE